MIRCLGLVLLASISLGCSAGSVDERSATPADSPLSDTTLVSNSGPLTMAAPESRKIVYSASLELVVEDFAKAEKKIQSLISEHQGYVAQSLRDRTYGDRLTGRWTVRVPVESFQAFIEAVEELGVPETFQTDAQDVTDEFVDLEARLKNKRRLEERIIKLIEERTGKIGDVVEVERELARVREEIERMQGRLLYLQNHVKFSTVTISMREDINYTPPQAPTFGSQIQATFSGSFTAMRMLGQALVLLFVALAPWLVLFTLLLTPLFFLWMMKRRNRATTARVS